MALAEREEGEPLRLLFAGGIAAVLHVVLFIVPLLSATLTPKAESAPISVDFDADAIQTESAPAAALTAPVPAVQPATAPLAAAAAPAASDYAVPTPKSTAQAASAVPAGQSFRETGSRTGASSGDARTSAPEGQFPNLPASVSPQAESQSTSAPAAPVSGKGVTVSEQGKQTSAGSLDLGSLDKALAGAKQGTKSGTAQGPAGQTARTGSLDNLKIQWDKPEAAKSRKNITKLEYALPAWVASSGLTFKLTVSFTVSPEGVVSAPKIEKSSGYGDIDAAIQEAFRKWRFNEDRTSGPIRGLVPIEIRLTTK